MGQASTDFHAIRCEVTCFQCKKAGLLHTQHMKGLSLDALDDPVGGGAVKASGDLPRGTSASANEQEMPPEQPRSKGQLDTFAGCSCCPLTGSMKPTQCWSGGISGAASAFEQPHTMSIAGCQDITSSMNKTRRPPTVISPVSTTGASLSRGQRRSKTLCF